jgi:hypothetical protein
LRRSRDPRRRRCEDDAEIDDDVVTAREQLLPLLRAAARAAPAPTRAFVADALASALDPATSASPADVEAALSAGYALGEGVPDDASAKHCGAMGPLASAALAAAPALPHASDGRVAVALLELAVRFAKAIPEPALPAALGAFLDARGVCHVATTVSARAAYLLTRFVRTLRPQLAPLAPAALEALQPALRAVARTVAADATSSSDVSTSGCADQLCVFEAAGLLLGAEEVPADVAVRYATAVLADLQQAQDDALGAAAAARDEAGAATAGAALAQVRTASI